MPLTSLLRQHTHALASSLFSHRLLFYFFASTLALFAAIANALKNFSNFYSVAIYLSKSSRSVLILANFGFLVSLLCAHAIQRLFFGSLRANEIERLYDRLWFFVTESLLAFTIFRDEFDIGFVLMFGALLFTKSFHWLAGDRIEWMDQRPYPGPPLLFHVRMCILFIVLWIVDLLMFIIALDNTLTYGVGGMVLFASEYGILMASVANSVAKYFLSACEFYRAGQRGGENAPPWENKSMWVFYVELTTDFLKLTIYLVFFTIIITFYGLPLNIVRDVYITARSFISRIRALHRYQAATRNMDQRYPNATEEEMSTMTDRTCIICREEMVLRGQAHNEQAPTPTEGPNTTPKKLPCGHIFHFHCLRSWLERQQSCPTCRRTVLDDNRPPQIQAQNRPAGAPRPAVLPPNPLPAQNANANGNNPAGNPAGLVDRVLGAQGDAPRVAVPTPQGPTATAQPAVIIQYQIQYQTQLPAVPQAPAAQPATTTQPQTLRTIPRFDGLPLPAEDRSARPNSMPRGNTSPTRTETSTAEASSSNILTPGRAAGQAALRRFTGEPDRTSLSPDQGNNDTDTLGQNHAVNQGSSIATQELPKLIPLHDMENVDTLVSASSSQSPSSQNPSYPSYPEHQSNGQDQRTKSYPIEVLNETSTRSSNLPPFLTDQQLSMMDRVTRESIDERLRVLEGVSRTVYRSIDELIRLRSTLPPSIPSLQAGGTLSSAAGLQSTTHASTSSAEGREGPEIHSTSVDS